LEFMTVEQGLELIQEERVAPLLKYLKTGAFENKTNMTFMKAYSVVVQFADKEPTAPKLYAYYTKVISDFCTEVMPQLKVLTGEEFLRKLAELWQKQTILVFWMQRVFQYLDRLFIKKNRSLFTVALLAFQEIVYAPLKARFVEALIEMINMERNGEEIDQDVTRLLVEMLCTVGGDSPNIVKQKSAWGEKLAWETSARGLYKVDFEPLFLRTTAEYYKKRAAGWMAECSCPAYLALVQQVLEDEERRLNQYLDRSSEEDLRIVLQRELILATAKQLVEMDTGCQAMFKNKRYSDLTLMYRLFRREAAMLCHITSSMEPYIQERCSRIVEDQQLIESPMEYVQQVLDLKAELDNMVATCFDNDSSFQRSRNQGLESILNKDSRCAKYLAIFSDNQLKRGLKGRNEDETMQLVSQVVGLFAHLEDKDIFLDFYKTSLSRRLLYKLSVSNDAEDAFITKLKVECGQQAIQKLASMFTDMGLSDQLQEGYSKCSHGASPGGVAHEMRVLQTNAWPEKATDSPIVLCEELQTCVQAFEAFYNSQHSGRKLAWIYNLGSVELATYGFERKHTLVASTFQGLVLMLFNKHKELTLGEICNLTMIPQEKCSRQVLSMTASKYKILLRDGKSKDIEDRTKFEVNLDFRNDKIKVVVPLIKEGEKVSAAAEEPTDRKHVIDAAIVRIMKSRKTLNHTQLLDELFRQCTLFKPQPQQVKVQIEHLIDREFLKREADKRNVYVYLP